VVASSRPDRFYTVVPRGNSVVIAEIDLAGRTHWSRRLPRGEWPVHGTDYGLLVTHDEGPRTPGLELRLVDARSGRVLRGFGPAGYVVAAGAGQVAWTDADCDAAHCQLLAADVRSGATRRYPLPPRHFIMNGVFSPDERRLALGFAGSHPEVAGTFEHGFAMVLDLDTGRSVRVPGVAPTTKQLPAMAWTPNGDWLAFALDWPDHQHLAFWRLGSDGLLRQPQRLAGGWEQAGLRGSLVVLP